jgi:hypothetical protein
MCLRRQIYIVHLFSLPGIPTENKWNVNTIVKKKNFTSKITGSRRRYQGYPNVRHESWREAWHVTISIHLVQWRIQWTRLYFPPKILRNNVSKTTRQSCVTQNSWILWVLTRVRHLSESTTAPFTYMHKPFHWYKEGAINGNTFFDSGPHFGPVSSDGLSHLVASCYN